MSLALDARQRAMLEEMGVRLFWPESAAEAEPVFEEEPVVVAPVAEVQAPVRARVPVPPPARPAAAPEPAARPVAAPRESGGGIELVEWDVRQRAVAGAVSEVGELAAQCLVLGDAPEGGADLAAQVAKLLDNMLAALGFEGDDKVYIASVRSPEESEAALRARVEQLRPRVILVMGRFAVQALMQTSDPIGRLRGRVHRVGDVPVVVTYPPGYLLRNLQDKARAWSDLVLAQSVLRG